MKIDVTRSILDLDGNEITVGEKPPRILTLGAAMKGALLAAIDGDKKGEEEFGRFLLAMRLNDARGEVEITIDEAKTIKDRVAQCYSTLVMGRIWQALEGSSPL